MPKKDSLCAKESFTISRLCQRKFHHIQIVPRKGSLYLDSARESFTLYCAKESFTIARQGQRKFHYIYTVPEKISLYYMDSAKECLTIYLDIAKGSVTCNGRHCRNCGYIITQNENEVYSSGNFTLYFI